MFSTFKRKVVCMCLEARAPARQWLVGKWAREVRYLGMKELRNLRLN